MTKRYDLEHLYRNRVRETVYLVCAIAVIIYAFWIRLDTSPFGVVVMSAAILGMSVMTINLARTQYLIHQDYKLTKRSETEKDRKAHDAKVLTDAATWIRGSYNQSEFCVNVLDERAGRILAGSDLNRAALI